MLLEIPDDLEGSDLVYIEGHAGQTSPGRPESDVDLYRKVFDDALARSLDAGASSAAVRRMVPPALAPPRKVPSVIEFRVSSCCSYGSCVEVGRTPDGAVDVRTPRTARRRRDVHRRGVGGVHGRSESPGATSPDQPGVRAVATRDGDAADGEGDRRREQGARERVVGGRRRRRSRAARASPTTAPAPTVDDTITGPSRHPQRAAQQRRGHDAERHDVRRHDHGRPDPPGAGLDPVDGRRPGPAAAQPFQHRRTGGAADRAHLARSLASEPVAARGDDERQVERTRSRRRTRAATSTGSAGANGMLAHRSTSR